jgi:Metalloenzyme superfamily/Type I phosphodiesterase / nucleotide pyrophosphatase
VNRRGTNVAIACVFTVVASVAAWRMATYALEFNDELAIRVPALAAVPPVIEDPKTPRLARRVFLIVVDGLRLDASHRPALDALRLRGTGIAAAAHYPSISRPGYITILTGVPPIASGVRANRVRTPIRLDSIMVRARAAGLRVTTASDIGMVPPLFMTNGPTDLIGIEVPHTGDLIFPPAGMTWPFDESRRSNSLQELEGAIAQTARTADLVFVLAGDVDRAGHLGGADGAAYAAAADAIDGAIGRLVATLDLAHDAIVITADHGHTGRGGHGGREPEVRAVPLILAGAGIVPGAQTAGAMLDDIAPTVSALLGIPSPGHAFGRTLVELLRLSPDAAAARSAADARRLATMRDAPRDEPGGPNLFGLVLVAACMIAAIVAMRFVPEIAVSRASWLGGLAFVLVVVGMFAICRGELSPSHVPALQRVQRWMAVIATVGIGAQVALGWRVLRRQPRVARLSAANGIALVGLTLALAPACAIRAWFAPPHAEVPEPQWFVAIPGVALAAAVAAIAIASMLVVELIVFARGKGRA